MKNPTHDTAANDPQKVSEPDLSPQEASAKIDDIIEAYRLNPSRFSAHRRLFDLYRRIDLQLRPEDAATGNEELRSALLALKHKLFDQATEVPALSLTDLTYKLALSRWDHPQRGDEAWSRGDRVAASVLQDLIAITGHDDARFLEAAEAGGGPGNRA
jgi:hypothetical protein